MLTKEVYFTEEQVVCVFPNQPADLIKTISTMGFKDGYPVIVLIGGDIQEQLASVTRAAIATLARVAEELGALVLCGGTDLDAMAEIGRIRNQNGYKFPLVGVTLKELVTWSGGPKSNFFMWRGKKRQELAPHFTHFILVPGTEAGEESSWTADAATILSRGHPSLTVLLSGTGVSRKDIELSIEKVRPVIALGGSGRLANELANEPGRGSLITLVPANSQSRLAEAIRAVIEVIHQDTLQSQPLEELPDPVPEIAEEDPVGSGDSQTFLSKRDEFAPINSEKSQYPLPDSFTK